jgi:hypothetical protein
MTVLAEAQSFLSVSILQPPKMIVSEVKSFHQFLAFFEERSTSYSHSGKSDSA